MTFTIPSRYEKSEYQEFMTFHEGDSFLQQQCASCSKYRADGSKNCKINDALRSAMGENYPIWSEYFVKITPKQITPTELDEKILCKLHDLKK